MYTKSDFYPSDWALIEPARRAGLGQAVCQRLPDSPFISILAIGVYTVVRADSRHIVIDLLHEIQR